MLANFEKVYKFKIIVILLIKLSIPFQNKIK